MKKLTTLLLTGLLVLSLTACGGNGNSSTSQDTEKTQGDESSSVETVSGDNDVSEGTVYDTGNFSVFVSGGWKEIPAIRNGEPDPDKLIVGKGFASEFDMLSKPYIEFLYGKDNTFGDPVTNLDETKAMFTDVVDAPAITIDDVTWEGFTGMTKNTSATCYVNFDGEKPIIAIGFFNFEGEMPTFDDADVQAILAGTKSAN